ncbi:MAG: hypothetical protein ACRCV9_17940 [Burkholderiaceae bacterium]
MKTVHYATNFTAGELSPRVRGRVDIAQFQAGARQMRNAYPLVTGGAVSRPGTGFVAPAKIANKKCRLIPFVIKKNVAYVVELGEGYARFYLDGDVIGGGTPYEITHPFVEAQLFDLDYAQDASTMYFTHEAVPMHRLRRFADNRWTSEPVPFTTPPVEEIGLRSSVSITLSLDTVGAGRTATASGAVFLASDVGRALIYQGGVLVVTTVNSATQVTGDITIAFAGTALPADQWTLDTSPQATLTPSAATPVGGPCTLTLGAAGWRNPTDIGKFVYINGGIVRITGITSVTIATGVIVAELSSATAAPALAWQLKSAQWNALDGYPRSVTLHQQRLVAAGSPGFPQTIWGSRVGEPVDFTVEANDSAGFSFTIGSDENNQIAYVASARHLMALTYGAEYSLRGQQARSVISTANPPEIIAESNHGSANVRPAQVRKELLFVQRAGKEVRSLNYRYDFDGYEAPDLAALADHFFNKLEDGTSLAVVDMAFQQRPHSLMWCVRSDGSLVSLTIDRAQSVIGWALHDVSGFVESVCCVPGVDGDVVYLAVRRTINGVTARYIERMEMTTSSNRDSEKYLLQTDMAQTVFNGAGQTTVTHSALKNTQVDVLADGTYMGRVAVNAAGLITLTRSAKSIQFGLPFTATVEPNSPEDASAGVAAMAQRMSTNRVTLRLIETGPVKINGQSIENRQFGIGVLDQPAPVKSQDVDVSEYGWDNGKSPVVVERELPFPMHVLAVVRELTVNQG